MLVIPPIYLENSQSILIVDDDPLILDLLSEVFRRAGFNVFIADNGLDGWHLFEKVGMEIVITDICMPGIDGIELSKRIRNHASHTKIAVMTGGDAEIAKKLLDDGTANYLFRKPFDINDVCTSLIPDVQQA